MAFSDSPFSGAPFSGGLVVASGPGVNAAITEADDVAAIAMAVRDAVAVAIIEADDVAAITILSGNPLATMLIQAPYAPDDILGTKEYQVYIFSGGSLVGSGSWISTGLWQVGNITNFWGNKIQQSPNGAFLDFYGVAVYRNINSTVKRAVRLYSPPRLFPTSLVKVELSTFQLSTTLGSAVAQTLTLSATTGTGITATAGGGTPFATGNNPVGKWLYAGNGRAKITARTSDTVVTISIVDDFASTGISSSGWSIGGVGYTLFDIDGNESALVTSNIDAVPGVKNCFAALITQSPDAYGGAQSIPVWQG